MKYYALLLGSRIKNNQEMQHFCQSDSMTAATDMVAFAQEHASEFTDSTCILRVCYDGKITDSIADITYNHNTGTFCTLELYDDILANLANPFRPVEMTADEAAAYIQQALNNLHK